MRRFYCPKCKKVRRTRKGVSDPATHEHRKSAGTAIKVPVRDCFRHQGGRHGAV